MVSILTINLKELYFRHDTVHKIIGVYRYFGVTLVSILTTNYGALGAEIIDANVGHLNDVTYKAFTHITVTKSLVTILTISKSLYH